MGLTGERRIPASPEQVWSALNDPQVIQDCLPGCIALHRTSDRDLNGIVEARIGAINARLVWTLSLAEPVPPDSCGMVVEAQDRMAGPISLQIGLSLHGEGAFTRLRYHVNGTAGGQFSHLSPEVGREWLHTFLDRFTTEVSATDEVMAQGPSGVFAAAANTSAHGHHPPALAVAFAALPAEIGGFPLVFWVGSFLFLLIFLLVFSAYL